MVLDDNVVEAIRGLIEELREVHGEKAFKLRSVRKAMAMLAANAVARGKYQDG